MNPSRRSRVSLHQHQSRRLGYGNRSGNRKSLVVFKLKANRDRPDFRVLIDLLFDTGRNVDTSGNCKFPSDRLWTDVYIRDRESDTTAIASNSPKLSAVALPKSRTRANDDFGLSFVSRGTDGVCDGC